MTKSEVSIPDRRVHASDATHEVVRYERAGKWYLEAKDGSARGNVSISEAIRFSVDLLSSGGTIHFGVPGGSSFDTRMKRLLGVGR